MLVRLARRVARQEAGVTLMEMVVAMGVFATVSIPLAGVLSSTMISHRLSQERTLAEEAAMGQIESMRSLPYDQVGVVDGNPPGSVTASRPIAAPGIAATLTTQISFVNDPTRTAYVTAADYKKVVVTVVRSRDGKRLTQDATYVAPPGRAAYGGINATIVKAQVVDLALNTPVSGAAISLATGPSAPRNDVTDATGTVTFAGLTSNPTTGTQAYYDISARATGYVVLRDDTPPGGAAHVQLAPGQTFNTAIRVYKPATLSVFLDDATGARYTGAATVTVGSSRGAQSFPVAGGALTVSDLGGEPLVPGLSYTVAAYSATGMWAPSTARAVPDAYPTAMSSTFTFTLALGATIPARTTLTVKTQTAAGAAVAGALVDLNGGPSLTYLTAVSDAAGTATFSVPSGAGYTAAVTGPSRSGTGTWSGTVSAPVTATVRIA